MFNNIGDFLLKRIGPAFARQALYGNISDIIRKQTHIDISVGNISIKNKTLFIKTNPIRKQQILIHKEQILSYIKEYDTQIEIEDIR